MSAAETDSPELQTLADAKVGDTVTVLIWNGWNHSYRFDKIERLTPTQLVLLNNKRFRVKDGNCIGTDRERIIVGTEAIEKRRQLEDEKTKRRCSNEWSADTRHCAFDRDTVLKVRAACDRAEAALRQLGEWRDEP